MASRLRSCAGRAALAALLVAAACDPYVEGNGVYGEEDRTPAATLHGVRVEDGIEATVISGAAQQRVVVSSDENLVTSIRTEVAPDHAAGPVVRVSLDFSRWSGTYTNPPRVVVQLAELRHVSTEGRSSHLDATGVETPVLSIEASAGSHVAVAGPGGRRIDVTASDATVDAASYPVAAGATVELSQRARVALHSDGPVDGRVLEGSTLENLLGTGSCAGVLAGAADATIRCAAAP